MDSSSKLRQDKNILRVLVVGETKVGKTLLIRRLCHQVFARSTAANTPITQVKTEDDDEEIYYFATQWGPTIGYQTDCLVRDSYANSFSASPRLCNASYEGTRYYAASGRPEDEASLYTAQTASQTRRCSGPTNGFSSFSAFEPSNSARTNDSGNTSPGQPSSTTSRAVRRASSAYGYEDDVVHSTSSSPRLAARDPSGTAGHPLQQQQQTTTRQTVELYELGGTRWFSPDCMLPLPLMEFDGIIFVYDRTNAASASFLALWYRNLRLVMSASPAGSDTTPVTPSRGNDGLYEGGTSPSRSLTDMSATREPRRPRLMLIGTQLQPTSLTSLLSRVGGQGPVVRGAEDDDDYGYLPSDDVLLNPEVRFQAQRQKYRKKGGRGLFGRLAHRMHRMTLSVFAAFQLLLSPSLILSEQYQEERSTRTGRFLFAFLERLARLLMLAERLVTFVMAITLFGVNQEVVMVRQPRSRAALEQIKEDPYFVAQCYICHLYDRVAFESCTDEIIGFFDTIHRDKLSSPL